MTETVLVTGGAGFIGSHLVERLAYEGRRVVIVDNFDPYYDRATKEANVGAALATGVVRLIDSDVRDGAALEQIFATFRPDKVVHLAARAGVRPSFEAPRIYMDINVGGTLNVLQSSRDFGVKKVLFASSSSVYGSVSEPANEITTPCKPLSPYGATKLAGEGLCSAYSHNSGMPVIALRFFTVYGPRQRPDMAVNRFTRMITDGEEVPVYGDGTSQRDYTYISDIISGIAAALDADLRGFHAVNLGRGQPLMLRDLLHLIELGLEARATLRLMPAQPGDPQSTCADVGTAYKLFGYDPRVLAQEGVVRYTEWFLEQQRERAGSR